MPAYDPAEWSDLCVAAAGAAAALTGLLFVAVSLNLERILHYRSLPIRAGETLAVLVSLLLVSLFVLVPGQPAGALGAELVTVGLVILVALGSIRLRTWREEGEPWSWTLVPLTVLTLSSVPLVIGGLSLITGAGGGLYWVLADLVFGFVGAAINAWILLVEIVR